MLSRTSRWPKSSPPSRKGTPSGKSKTKGSSFEARMERVWDKFKGGLSRIALTERDKRNIVSTLQATLLGIQRQATQGKWDSEISDSPGMKNSTPRVDPTAFADITNRSHGTPQNSFLTPQKQASPERPMDTILEELRQKLYESSASLRQVYRSFDTNRNNRAPFSKIWKFLEKFHNSSTTPGHVTERLRIHEHAQMYMVTNPGGFTFGEFSAFFVGRTPPEEGEGDTWRTPEGRREFLASLEKIRASGRNGRLLRAIFLRMDTNRDNLLSFKELSSYLSSHNVPSNILMDPRFKEYIAGHMLTRPGFLTYPEFLTLVHQNKPAQRDRCLMEVSAGMYGASELISDIITQIDPTAETLKQTFQHYDKASIGRLSEEQFFHAMGDLCVRCTPAAVREIFDSTKKFHDGTIEYSHLLLQEHSSENSAELENIPLGITSSRRASPSQTQTVRPNAREVIDQMAKWNPQTDRKFSRQSESSFAPNGEWKQDIKQPPITARKHKSMYAHGKDNINLFHNPQIDRNVSGTNDECILAEISRQFYSTTTGGLRGMFKKMCSTPRYLTLEDFRRGLRRFGLRYPEKPLLRIWNRFDTNGNGKLGFSEFVRMLGEGSGSSN